MTNGDNFYDAEDSCAEFMITQDQKHCVHWKNMGLIYSFIFFGKAISILNLILWGFQEIL